MFDRGYAKIATLGGIPIRVHWSMPLGALIFSGFRLAPAFWLAFFLLVLLHELGHAFFVRRYRHHVLSIDVTGFGGLCRWSGYASPYQRAVIAWGGVLAQALLFVATFGVVLVVGAPRVLWAAEIVHVFTTVNLWLIALNLLPFPPLDGAEAWPLVRHLFDRARARFSGSRPSRAGTPPPRVESRSVPRAPDPEAARLADAFREISERARRARRS